MVDALVSGASAERRVGSSPILGTSKGVLKFESSFFICPNRTRSACFASAELSARWCVYEIVIVVTQLRKQIIRLHPKQAWLLSSNLFSKTFGFNAYLSFSLCLLCSRLLPPFESEKFIGWRSGAGGNTIALGIVFDTYEEYGVTGMFLIPHLTTKKEGRKLCPHLPKTRTRIKRFPARA